MPPYGAQPLTDERPLDLFPLAGALPEAPSAVEVNLGLTHFVRRFYTQRQSLCVAFSSCQALTYFNGRMYDPGWAFYNGGGDPNRGASTAQVCDVLRTKGARVIEPPYPSIAPEDDTRNLPGTMGEGIRENRWLSRDGAQALQDVRTTLSLRVPVLFVIPVYGERQIGERMFWDVPAASRPTDWHQICLTYASDAEGIIGSDNSWGDGPMYCSTYDEFVRLVNVHNAYGTVITDNITGTEGVMPHDPNEPAPGPSPTPTPTPTPTPEPQRFECPSCGRTFKRKSALRRHQRRKGH